MNKRKVKLKYIIIFIFVILSLIGIVYSLYNIINWNKDTSVNKSIKKEIDKSINISIEEKEIKYDINWNELKEQNSDTVAYIKINNTNIDYIVVKGTDNNYYLKHNFNKEYNSAGWIFADYRNKFNEFDKNIIIYGHNTKDGSMFGTLKNTLKEEWYSNKDNQVITFVTENKINKYQIFSIYEDKASDYPITTEFDNNNEYLNFLNNIKNKSIYNFDIDVSSEQSILTLSTCASNNKNRITLHAINIQ